MNTPDKSLINYIREASRLRQAIAVSEEDEKFAHGGGHVHYLLDTNVVGMFIRPQRHIYQLGMFPNWLDNDTLTATATLTSEFLLSTKLPGQMDGAALLSPDHYEEVISLATKAATALEALPSEEFDSSLNEMDGRKAKIVELAILLCRDDVSTERKLNALNETLPREVATFVRGPLAELIQLKRVFEQGSIRRIDGMPWFHASGLSTDTRKELEWYKRVRASRLEIEAKQNPFDIPSPQPDGGLTINQMSDARTLALLLQITEQFAEDRHNHRFLFVTADSSIRHAIEKFAVDQENDEKARKFDVFVRHPREFVPLLNLTNMTGDEDLRVVFSDLKLAVDELLTGLTPKVSAGGVYIEPTESEIIGSLAAKGSVGLSHTDRSARGKLDALEKCWKQACRSALSPNAQLLRQRDEFLFGEIAELLNSSDLRTHVRKHIVEALSDLLRDHAGLNVDGVFAAVAQLGFRRSEGGFSPQGIVLRVPFPLVRTALFADYLGRQDLNSYLLRIARGHDVADLSKTLLRKERDPIAYLFLACVCLAVGLWEAAKDFARRSLATRRQQVLSRETRYTAQYVLAVSLRMALRSREDLRLAENELTDSIEKHREARVEPMEAKLALRGQAELAAIKIAAVEHTLYAMESRGEFRRKTLIRERDVPQYIAAAGELLSTVIHSIEDNFPMSQTQLGGILLQSYSNAAALSIAARISKKSSKARAHLDIDDNKIIEGIESSIREVDFIPPTIPMYLDALRALSEPDYDRALVYRHIAIDSLSEIRERDIVLPRIDIEVAEMIIQKLREPY